MTGKLTINVTYVDSAPEPDGMAAAVDTAVAFIESQFSDPITLNIALDLGTIGAAHSQYSLVNVPYTTLRSALIADPGIGASLAAVLPTSDPMPDPHTWLLTTTEAKALNSPYNGEGSMAVDGTITVSNAANVWDFNPSDGISPKQVDFVDAIEHELTEIMGREVEAGADVSNVGTAYSPLDLFRYAAPGTRCSPN